MIWAPFAWGYQRPKALVGAGSIDRTQGALYQKTGAVVPQSSTYDNTYIPVSSDVTRANATQAGTVKKTSAIWIILVFGAVLAFGQTDNTLYVKQFAGATVGAKLANAMQACSADTSIPCILVLDPSLVRWPTGTMPGLCSQCSLLDYRSGAPASSSLVKHAENFSGATASERITACLAAAGAGTCDATGLTGVQMMDATVEVGNLCSVNGQTTALAQTLITSQSTTFQPTTAGLTMFQVDCNGQLLNMHIYIPPALSFTGKAVQVVDTITNQNINTFSLDGLSIDAGTYSAGGYGLYLAPPVGGWIQLVNFRNIRIQGTANNLTFYANGAGTYINGNNLSDVMLEGGGSLLNFNCTATCLQIDGNTFANLQTDGSGVAISYTGSGYIQHNLFLGARIWDTSTPISNANSKAQMNVFIGQIDNPYTDPQSGFGAFPYANVYIQGSGWSAFAAHDMTVTGAPVWGGAHNTGAVGWNFSAGQAETDYFQNVYTGGTYAHEWFAANSGNTGWQALGGFSPAGAFNAVGGFKNNGTAGYTGSKTAGTCVLTIAGGIITNVTGC